MNLSTFPQVCGDEVVQIRCLRLNKVCDVLQSVQVYKFSVVCVVYEHQVEVFAGVDDVVHLGVVICPACDLNIDSYADLFFCVIADLRYSLIEIVCRCSAYSPPYQGRYFTIACCRIRSSFCSGCSAVSCGRRAATACQHSSCHSGNNAQGKNLVHALVFHNVSSLKSGSLYAESPFLYHSRFFRQDIKLKHTDNIGNISP